MSDSHPGPGLRGRRTERAALDRLLAEARSGRSRVLVLRGEAGVGKTALLDYLQEQARGFSVARAAGVESEMELAFAGLHQLCTPMLSSLAGLPDPQRDALGTVFGLSAGEAPGRLLVGLSVLGLLSEVAEELPLVCLVDDAQWLDQASAQALAFVARRLLAEPVALVFAVREPSEEQHLGGLPLLRTEGLSDGDARALLDSVTPGRLDAPVRDRIVAETRGNPLALLELPRGLSAAELAGGFGLPDTPAAGEPHRAELPATVRVASGQDATAAARGGSGADRRCDLVVARCRVARHRSGRGGPRRGRGADRARRPGALPSSAAARRGLPARRPCPTAGRCIGRWPRRPIQAPIPTAGRGIVPMRLRGLTRLWPASWSGRPPGRKAAGASPRRAAFLQRSTELTPDPARRGARALAAARAKFAAAAPDAAYELLAAAELGRLDELQRAELARLRAQMAFAERRGSDAPRLLLDAAKKLEPLDAGWRGRPTWKRSERRSSPVASAVDSACERRLRRPGPRRRRRSRRGRWTCCWTGSRRGSPRATSRAYRRSGEPWMRSGETAAAARTTSWAGSGWRAGRARTHRTRAVGRRDLA